MAKKSSKIIQVATVGQVQGVIQFEPCTAPISTKADIKGELTLPARNGHQEEVEFQKAEQKYDKQTNVSERIQITSCSTGKER